MKVLNLLSPVVALVLVALPLNAQEQQTQAPSSAPSSSTSISSLDTQGIKKYLLGPGDVLDIRFFGQSELNTAASVDSEGNLSSLPFIETPIRAKCRTEKEVQQDIIAAYSKLINKPQISVRIAERNSRAPATIFGAVRTPQRAQMQRRVRLNELMALAGGFTERAAGTIQILHTEPLMCPEPGEELESAPIDGTNIPLEVVQIGDLRAGKKEANPTIRPGDYVLVTEAEPVYITGSVLSPSGIYLRDKLTLGLALAMVGGPRKEAKLSDVRIYRQKPGTTEREIIKVDFGAIKKNQAADVVLQPYDVVEVGEASPFSGSRIGSTLLQAVTGGLTSTLTTGLPNRIIY
ncbi:MAG TPA: SLBB domain-containing protein [Pyrinomonadaceae bacterium]|nr:SLBB domain-containing protein [Pyrinomonadaceae bacterium]